MQAMQTMNQGEGTIKIGQTEFILRISLIPLTSIESVTKTVELPQKRAIGRPRKPVDVEASPVKLVQLEAKTEPKVTRIKLRSPMKDNQYLGKIGDRKVFKLVLQEQKQDRIGTTSRWVYVFREETTGKTALWMTYRDHRLVDGETYSVNASVKKFYDRRGVKSTLLTRGKIVEAEE
jgi:hypothetical protein